MEISQWLLSIRRTKRPVFKITKLARESLSLQIQNDTVILAPTMDVQSRVFLQIVIYWYSVCIIEIIFKNR